MSSHAKVAAAKLVIVVGPFELAEHLTRDLKALGARGFTTMRVDGFGSHGARTYGVLDGANVRFEVVAKPEVAQAILARVAEEFAERGVIAYAHPVEAAPAGHFE